MVWHPMIEPNRVGATAESNQEAMEYIRSLPKQIELDNEVFIDNPIRMEAIENMVVSNIPLVILKAETYVNLHNNLEFLQDDLISEGLLALNTAVQDLADSDTPEDGGNCTAYLSTRVLWALCNYVDKEEYQQIPTGYAPPGPHVIDPRDIVEARDLLESACLTPEDHVIIQMREKGSTDQEIADSLNIPRRAVNFMRQDIFNRYQDFKNRDD